MNNGFIFDVETGTERISYVAEGTIYDESLRDGELLTYGDFLDELTGAVRERFGRFARHYDIECRQVLKNNSVRLDSILIHENGCPVAPNIYVNHFYSRYLEGRPIFSLADEISSVYFNSVDDFDMNRLCDFTFEAMKDNIIFKLSSYGKNEELLEGTPYIRYKDLAVSFHCLVRVDNVGIGTIRLTDEHCCSWGITRDELLACARKNTERLLPYRFRNIFEVLADLMLRELDEHPGDSDERSEIERVLECVQDNSPERMGNSMYVLTNESGINGSACLLYPGVLETIGRELGGGFFIIPSSVHEVIIVPDSVSTDPDYLRALVSGVNREHVMPEDVLSDSVYHYPEDDFGL